MGSQTQIKFRIIVLVSTAQIKEGLRWVQERIQLYLKENQIYLKMKKSFSRQIKSKILQELQIQVYSPLILTMIQKKAITNQS